MRVRVGFSCLAFAAGCSEYEVTSKDDVGPGGDSSESSDTGTCASFDPPDAPEVEPDAGCVNEPDVGSFDPVVEWQWTENPVHSGYDQVMAAPVAANLTDDNGDGLVDESDVPDVVFTAYPGVDNWANGTLVAVSGDGTATHWSIADAGGYTLTGIAGVAVGDLENDGSPDVCAAGNGASVVCVEADGTFKWAAAGEMPYGGLGHPAIADLDADGSAEVVHGRQVFDASGTLVGTGAYGQGSCCWSNSFLSVPADMDGDGELEVVAGNAVYERDGTALWYDGGTDGCPAVADFDGDPDPESVRVGGGAVTLSDNDGTTLWSVSLPGGGYGGPPTVADFDGDGEVEVGVAGLAYYSVFETDGSVRWSDPTSDYSSSCTGSSVFDFEGDGVAEVVYADEHTVWVFGGPDGSIRMQQDGHASGTGFEYPIVADVDADGATEIVLGSNTYLSSGWNGITVIGDASSSWAPARPIWNQHAYHITNVENDGGIPRAQAPNWLTWNNFRAGGTELGPAHWLADLAPGDPEICAGACEGGSVLLYATVANEGLLAAGTFTVSFSGGEEWDEEVALLGSGEGTVLGPFEVDRAAWGGDLVVRVDSGGDVEECDEGDNAVSLGAWPCDE